MFLVDTNIWLELLLNMLDDQDCKLLDFDDTYQYCAAKKKELKIISFDRDFDKTKSGRITPSEVK